MGRGEKVTWDAKTGGGGAPGSTSLLKAGAHLPQGLRQGTWEMEQNKGSLDTPFYLHLQVSSPSGDQSLCSVLPEV